MNQPPAPHTPAIGAAPPRSGLSRRLLWLLAFLGLAGIAVPLLIVARGPQVVPAAKKVAKARPPQRVIPPAELPPVEPAEFVAVAPEDALAYNASIPFSKAPLLPARPFRIEGDAESVARATDCLTAGVLYEAGDDTVGQRAVAQVILNRVRHPAFPKTVCGVVFQGAERRTGCQFTFTCDGALERRYSDAAWKRAAQVASAALTGRVDKSVGTATHYHTNWVVPYWSASLDKISEVHTHLFFRWTGWWGTPPAFRGRYLAAEPFVTKLKGIAASHGAAPDAPMAEASLAPGTSDPVSGAAFAPTGADANVFLLTLDPLLAPNDYPAVAARACGDRAYCKLLAWTDRADTPVQLPAEPAQMDRMAFSYLRDRSIGFEKPLWNCKRFNRSELSQCMQSTRPVPALRRLEAPAAGAAAPVPAKEGPAELSRIRRKTGTLASPTRPAVTPPLQFPAGEMQKTP